MRQPTRATDPRRPRQQSASNGAGVSRGGTAVLIELSAPPLSPSAEEVMGQHQDHVAKMLDRDTREFLEGSILAMKSPEARTHRGRKRNTVLVETPLFLLPSAFCTDVSCFEFLASVHLVSCVRSLSVVMVHQPLAADLFFSADPSWLCVCHRHRRRTSSSTTCRTATRRGCAAF